MQSAINEGNRILCSEDQLKCVVESETELKKSSKHLFVNPIIYLTYIWNEMIDWRGLYSRFMCYRDEATQKCKWVFPSNL